MKGRRKYFIKPDHPGYALLWVLVIILILGMVYYYRRMHGPVYQIGQEGESDIMPPWRQWHDMNVRQHKAPLGQPRAEQPQLTEILVVWATPMEKNEERGKMKLAIYPEGKVEGEWGGIFKISRDVDFQVMGCRFEGNIDPKQVYSDTEGEDGTKLFFITKGKFVILETNDDTGKVRSVLGDSYVRGWLSADNTIKGELIITSDERNFYCYTWQGVAEESGLIGLD